MLKRRFSLLIIATLLCFLSLHAGSPWLKRPLRFAPSDSVLIWGYDGRDYRTKALKSSPDAAVYPILLTQKEWKERKAIYKEWTEKEKGIGLDGCLRSDGMTNRMVEVASLMTRAVQLFRMQGDVRYTDYIERALFNGVMHSLNDTLPVKGTIDQQIAANLLFTMPGLIYATSGEGDVYVNLYTNSTASLATGETHFSLDQITDMPLNGRIKLRINNIKPATHLRLHLRQPEWMKEGKDAKYSYAKADSITPTVFVNGHEVEHLQTNEKGYWVIDREWNPLDEVYLDLPLQAQYVVSGKIDKPFQKGQTLCDHVDLQFGPLAYQVEAKGFFTHTDWGIMMGDELSPSDFPQLRLFLSQGDGKGEDALRAASRGYDIVPCADGVNNVTSEKTETK